MEALSLKVSPTSRKSVSLYSTGIFQTLTLLVASKFTLRGAGILSAPGLQNWWLWAQEKLPLCFIEEDSEVLIVIFESKLHGNNFKSTPHLFPDIDAIPEPGLGASSQHTLTHCTPLWSGAGHGATEVEGTGLTPRGCLAWSSKLMDIDSEPFTQRTKRK